jgi:hypothetical protein
MVAMELLTPRRRPLSRPAIRVFSTGRFPDSAQKQSMCQSYLFSLLPRNYPKTFQFAPSPCTHFNNLPRPLRKSPHPRKIRNQKSENQKKIPAGGQTQPFSLPTSAISNFHPPFSLLDKRFPLPLLCAPFFLKPIHECSIILQAISFASDASRVHRSKLKGPHRPRRKQV